MSNLRKFNFKYLLKVILYISALLFAIYLVLLASGYKFDYRNKRYVETGSIYINSNPKDVKIYINGRLKSSRAPFKLGYLLPASYQVKIEKDGYQSWEKNVLVKPGMVNYEGEIILYYNQPELKSFSSIEKIKGMKINDAKDELIYFTDQNIYWQKTNSDQTDSFQLAGGLIMDVIASKDLSKFVIFKKDETSGISSYIYCADRKCQQPYDLNQGLSLNFDRAKITDDGNFPLLLSAQGNLYAVKDNFSKYYIETKVLDFAYFDSKIYYLTDEENGVGISFSDPEGVNKTKVTDQKAYGSEKNKFSLNVDKKEDRLFLIGEGQDLYQLINSGQPPKKIKTQATALNFDNNNFLLIIFENEIKVQGKVELTDEEDSFHQVARYSQNPINLSWLLRTNHILFIRDAKLKTVEVEGSNETDLYSFGQEGPADFNSISKNEILVLNQGRLSRLTVCEKGSLIDFWQ